MTHIAVVRDGPSDYRVIRQFITAIFKQHHSIDLNDSNFIDLDLRINDTMARYIDTADKTEDYSLFSKHAKELRNGVSTVLYTALGRVRREVGDLSNKDVLIVYTDTEKKLQAKNRYFEQWACTLNSVLWLAIEEFYEKMVNQGYEYEHLPLALPLILFPSSEILVAACMYDFKKENFRTLEAKPALKQKVYGTDTIPSAVQSGKLEEVVSTFVVPDMLKDIYREIPEARQLMQILCFTPR